MTLAASYLSLPSICSTGSTVQHLLLCVSMWVLFFCFYYSASANLTASIYSTVTNRWHRCSVKMLAIFKELFWTPIKSYIVQQQAASINHWYIFSLFPSPCLSLCLSLFQACGFGCLGKLSFCLSLAYSKCHIVTACIQIVIAEHRCRILFCHYILKGVQLENCILFPP